MEKKESGSDLLEPPNMDRRNTAVQLDIPMVPSAAFEPSDDELEHQTTEAFCSPKDGEGLPEITTAATTLQPGESPTQSPTTKRLQVAYEQMTKTEMDPWMRFYHILHGSPALAPDKWISLGYNIIHFAMIILTTLVVILESLPQFYDPTISTEPTWNFVCESITVAFFTLDLMMRVVSAGTWKFLVQMITIVDFLSVIGYYIELIVLAAGGSSSGGGIVFIIFGFLRLGRIMRLLKLARSHKGVQLMWNVVMKSKDGLLLLLILVAIATLFFSAVIYYAEQTGQSFNDNSEQWIRDDGTISPYQSIPHTFWFIICTLTTVGYGNDTPRTASGRGIALLAMLFGVLVLSFPNILIGSNFQDAHKELHRNKARQQLGVWFRRVRMVVRFIRLWREFRIHGRIISIPKEDSLILVRSGSFAGRRKSHAGGLQRHTTGVRVSNFLCRPKQDFLSIVSAEGKVFLDTGRLEWNNRGITCLDMLQRLLEGFSATCSIDEMTEAYMIYPSSTVRINREAVFEMAVNAASANLVQLFVIHRNEKSGVITVTKKGIEYLLHYAESDPMPCMRSYSDARNVWTSTSKQKWVNFLPMDGYRNWQEIQKTVANRPYFEYIFDYSKPESTKNNLFVNPPLHSSNMKAQLDRLGLTGGRTPLIGPSDPTSPCFGQCGCKHCTNVRTFDDEDLLGSPLDDKKSDSTFNNMHPLGEFCFDPDEEYLRLQIQLANNALQIFLLRRAAGVEKPKRGAGNTTPRKHLLSPRSQLATPTIPPQYQKMPPSSLKGTNGVVEPDNNKRKSIISFQTAIETMDKIRQVEDSEEEDDDSTADESGVNICRSDQNSNLGSPYQNMVKDNTPHGTPTVQPPTPKVPPKARPPTGPSKTPDNPAVTDFGF